MNFKKSIVVGDGVEKRYRVGENDREKLRLLLQVVDDFLGRGRGDINFIETRDFIFFEKRIFQRLVVRSYEIMYWELKKAVQYVLYLEGVKTDFENSIMQKEHALKAAWRIVEKQCSLLEKGEARLKDVQDELAYVNDELEVVNNNLRSYEKCFYEKSLKIMMLKNANLKLKKSNDTALVEAKAMREKVEGLEGELVEVNCKSVETKSELAKMQEALDEEKRGRAAEKAEYEKEIARLKAELSMLNERAIQ